MINWKENIWFPVDENANVLSMFENSQDLRLNVKDPDLYSPDRIHRLIEIKIK